MQPLSREGAWGCAPSCVKFRRFSVRTAAIIDPLRVYKQVATTVQRAKDEGDLPLVGFEDVSPAASVPCAVVFLTVLAPNRAQVKDFVLAIQQPRKIIMLVKAGKPVDDTIAVLKSHMSVRRGAASEHGYAEGTLFPLACAAWRRVD